MNESEKGTDSSPSLAVGLRPVDPALRRRHARTVPGEQKLVQHQRLVHQGAPSLLPLPSKGTGECTPPLPDTRMLLRRQC